MWLMKNTRARAEDVFFFFCHVCSASDHHLSRNHLLIDCRANSCIFIDFTFSDILLYDATTSNLNKSSWITLVQSCLWLSKTQFHCWLKLIKPSHCWLSNPLRTKHLILSPLGSSVSVPPSRFLRLGSSWFLPYVHLLLHCFKLRLLIARPFQQTCSDCNVMHSVDFTYLHFLAENIVTAGVVGGSLAWNLGKSTAYL